MKLNTNFKDEFDALDLDRPILEKKKSLSRFIITSGIVHIITATAIVMTQHIPKNEIKDVTEVVISTASDFSSAPEIAPAPEQAAVVVEEQAQEALPVEPAEPLPTAPAPVIVAKSHSEPKVSNEVKKTTSLPAKPAPAATIDDIETPLLDESAVVAHNTVENLNPADLDQALDKIDAQNENQIQAATAQIQEDTEQVADDLATSSVAAKEQIEQQEKAEAAAIAAASARAEAEKKAMADKLVAENAQKGLSNKNAGPGVKSEQVRALEQLRQVPGNPKPQYNDDERLQGHKGVIVMQAYVTPEGRLTNFKMLKSTGHRNLDGKTLTALKQWKFYPGQEGWVELPFDWNLKGGPQEMPAFLRRKVGQGN